MRRLRCAPRRDARARGRACGEWRPLVPRQCSIARKQTATTARTSVSFRFASLHCCWPQRSLELLSRALAKRVFTAHVGVADGGDVRLETAVEEFRRRHQEERALTGVRAWHCMAWHSMAHVQLAVAVAVGSFEARCCRPGSTGATRTTGGEGHRGREPPITPPSPRRFAVWRMYAIASGHASCCIVGGLPHVHVTCGMSPSMAHAVLCVESCSSCFRLRAHESFRFRFAFAGFYDSLCGLLRFAFAVSGEAARRRAPRRPCVRAASA